MLRSLLLVACALACALAAEDFYAGTDVVSLTDKTFKSSITDNEIVMVEFYAPWCGHCKSLKPIYAEVAKKLKGKVMIAAVDATAEAGTGSEYDVKGFPTISIFSQGNRVIKEYSGERTADAMVTFMEGLIESKGVPPSSSSYDNSDVVTLTDKNFEEEVLKNSGDVFVEFYAPWCGHCQSLVPIFKEVATELKGSVTLAALESIQYEAVADKYNVQGYPTLLLFQAGEMVEEYEGERTKKSILDFLGGGKETKIEEIETEDQLNAFLENPLVVVAHFQKENDSLEKLFKESQEAVVLQLDNIKYGQIKDPVLAKKLGWNFSPSAKLIRKADKFEVKYNFFGSPTTNKKLVSWVFTNFLPPLDELTVENAHILAGVTEPMLVYMAGGPLDLDDAMKGKLIEIANKNNEHFNLLWADHSSGEEFLLDNMLVDLNVDPKKKYVTLISEKKWWAIDLTDSKEPLDKVVADLAEKYTSKDADFEKSGEKRKIPDLNEGMEGQSVNDVDQKDPVFNLVSSIFKATVLDTAPDFFIEFYAPWCGHCKALQPTWDSLVTALKDVDVVIAKMDATANDIPHEFKVEGFPTLMYVKKVKDSEPEIIEYSGGRDLEDLKKWVLDTHVPAEWNKKPAEGLTYYPPKVDGENLPEPKYSEELESGEGSLEGDLDEEEAVLAEEEANSQSAEEENVAEKSSKQKSEL